MAKTNTNDCYTKSQRRALKAVAAGDNVFITGKAGTGKSYVTKEIIRAAQEQGRRLVICAPTGVSAINIGGTTIHRAFALPVGITEPRFHCTNKDVVNMIEASDMILVDEISMCRTDLFTGMMNTIKQATASSYRQKQLVFVGDFFQLPPVITQRELQAYKKLYKGIYAFESPLWKEAGLRTIELKENMRQKDLHLMEILDAIRLGKADLYYLNEMASEEADPLAVTICTTNKRASKINTSHLEALPGKTYRFATRKSGTVEPQDLYCDDVLALKTGSRVMTLVNGEAYSNGSSGTVTAIDAKQKKVEVLMDHSGETVSIEPHTWEVIEYVTGTTETVVKRPFRKKTVVYDNNVQKSVIGIYTQFPLRLAWAVTIHKSQGQTFDRINICAMDRFFAPGQLYVALSRCRTLSGMTILGKIPKGAVKADPVVKNFIKGKKEYSLL